MFQTISTGGIQVQKTNWIIAALSVWVMASCGPEARHSYEVSSASDAKAFVEAEAKTNSHETKIKEVNFKLKYISAEEMALRNLGDVSKFTQASFDSMVKDYEGQLYFNLEVSIDHFNEEILHYKMDPSAGGAFEERVNYYSFNMQKDICIVIAEKDTIPCTMYHYERNYGISPKNNFMLGFETKQLKDAVLVYDNKYLTTGPVKFALSEQELLNHSQIKIK
jgi:hypothetical protein